MFPEITIGIRPTDTPALTPNEMRVAIVNAERDCLIVHRAMMTARYSGWSGEDLYVAIAYSALRSAHDSYKQQIKVLSAMPMNPIVIVKEPG